MWNKKNRKKVSRLSKEILGILGVSLVISVFLYVVIKILANCVMVSYCEKTGSYLTTMQELTAQSWIKSISFASAVLFFVVLFLFLLGQKLAYLHEIIKGVEALRMHRMDYVMPVEGENEFADLAKSINYMSETEQKLVQKEAQLRQEKEALLRALSHDIRTPLTAVLSYSEFMTQKDHISEEEAKEFAKLIRYKGIQIKELTDRLLDAGKRSVEYFENGQLLMEQLAEEWRETLEDDFTCEIDFSDCKEFTGEFDIQEIQRIFDNLISNIKKYADPDVPVKLSISADNERVYIVQSNRKKVLMEAVESRNIGLFSVRQIVSNYHGFVEVEETERLFEIKIVLLQNSLELQS